MLLRFSDSASYGIPVGPAASRTLGEAVLIDVDSTLMSYEIDFLRFTDDFVIFATTPEEAEYGLRVLGETLFQIADDQNAKTERQKIEGALSNLRWLMRLLEIPE